MRARTSTLERSRYLLERLDLILRNLQVRLESTALLGEQALPQFIMCALSAESSAPVVKFIFADTTPFESVNDYRVTISAHTTSHDFTRLRHKMNL